MMIFSIPPSTSSIGLQIHAPADDIHVLLILAVDREEARRLTLGPGHHLFLVGGALLHEPLGRAARARNDVVPIGLGLVLRPLLVGARRLHIAEGGNHGLRRRDVLRLDLGDLDAGAVVVEDLLREPVGLLGQQQAFLGQCRLQAGLADHLAHGALGRVLYRALRRLDVEKELPGVADAPENGELHVDDVLVAGQHQALVRHRLRERPPVGIDQGPVTDSRPG